MKGYFIGGMWVCILLLFHQPTLLFLNHLLSSESHFFFSDVLAGRKGNAVTVCIMYSTFLTASPGSVLFRRSNLLKRKDLCFSYLRFGLESHRRRLRSSHLSSQVIDTISSLSPLEKTDILVTDILVNISIGIQTVLS